MLGIYFSGTGNSRYALEFFLGKYDKMAKISAIENENIAGYIKDNEEIVFSYSVQYSNIPKMLKDFIDEYQDLWRGELKFFIGHSSAHFPQPMHFCVSIFILFVYRFVLL